MFDDDLREVVGSMCMGEIAPLPGMKLHGFVCRHVPVVKMTKQTYTINIMTGQIVAVGDMEEIEMPLPSHAIYMSKN
jgi:hypothetical protein